MKWYTYVLCFILIAVGCFCGFRLYTEYTAKSYVKGSIDISNQFSQEDFKYVNSSLAFYHDDYDDTDTYSFEKDLLKVDDFNGIDYEYQVKLNDFVLLDTQVSAGSVYSVMSMDFYNIEGAIACSATLNISVKFLSDKTILSMAVVGNDDYSGSEQSQFFEQYFSDNGIRLSVLRIL